MPPISSIGQLFQKLNFLTIITAWICETWYSLYILYIDWAVLPKKRPFINNCVTIFPFIWRDMKIIDIYFKQDMSHKLCRNCILWLILRIVWQKSTYWILGSALYLCQCCAFFPMVYKLKCYIVKLNNTSVLLNSI